MIFENIVNVEIFGYCVKEIESFESYLMKVVGIEIFLDVSLVESE